MTSAEMSGLKVGDTVLVVASGKVYRCCYAEHVGDVVPRLVWSARARTMVYENRTADKDHFLFVQRRADKDFGRRCVLTPENIRRVSEKG